MTTQEGNAMHILREYEGWSLRGAVKKWRRLQWRRQPGASEHNHNPLRYEIYFVLRPAQA